MPTEAPIPHAAPAAGPRPGVGSRFVARWLRRRGRRRRLAILLGLLACFIATPLLVALGLSRATPAWWTRVQTLAPDAASQAESLEAAAMAQASLVRPGATTDGRWRSEPWSVSLSEADANAWLGERLPRWVESRGDEVRWPRPVRAVRVAFHEDSIWLGALVLDAAADGNAAASIGPARDPQDQPASVLSVALTPRMDDAGQLWLAAGSVGVGRLTLPPGTLRWAQHHPRASPLLPTTLADQPELAALLDVLRGATPASIEPSLGLGDGRRVRLLNIKAREGRLELTCQTEAKRD